MKLVMALFIGKLVELRKKRCYTEIHRMMSQAIHGQQEAPEIENFLWK